MNEQNQNVAVEELDLNEVIKLRREKLATLVEEGNNPFEEVKFEKSVSSVEIINNFEKYEGQEVSFAGRMVSRRIMGKASFAHILDGEGKLQFYIKKDDVGEDNYLAFKGYDIGDIIGITGTVFKTKTGEVSLHTTSIKLLSKSLLPLPEKFHGLKDNDLRYRQRYVDIIADPEVKEAFIIRSKIITAIREYLDGQGFVEVETPILNVIAGGANARPFITKHNTLDINMYLRIAPELYLKRLIVGGFEKVYELGRVFRNEGMDMKHNPEFTILEAYQAYTDYNGMMDLTEGIYHHVLDKVLGKRVISFQGEEIDMSGKFERLTMIDAVKKYLGVDFNNENLDEIKSQLKEKGVEIEDSMTWGKLLYEAFDQKVEAELLGPVFIIDYPVEVSPLAKKKKDDKRLTDRFEFFITRREMGNAYSELNDPIDQKSRFLEQCKAKEAGDEEAHAMDEDFINALEYGMPPTGGLGLGIDRLVMLLTDNYSIRDVLLFPTMKPKK